MAGAKIERTSVARHGRPANGLYHIDQSEQRVLKDISKLHPEMHDPLSVLMENNFVFAFPVKENGVTHSAWNQTDAVATPFGPVEGVWAIGHRGDKTQVTMGARTAVIATAVTTDGTAAVPQTITASAFWDWNKNQTRLTQAGQLAIELSALQAKWKSLGKKPLSEVPLTMRLQGDWQTNGLLRVHEAVRTLQTAITKELTSRGTRAPGELPMHEVKPDKTSAADEHRVNGHVIKPHADLRGAFFENADLSGASLSGANLQRVPMWSAKLSNADLSGAMMQHAYLRGADLQGANLQGANLYEAVLEMADLRRADMRTVSLRNTLLYKADLRGAIFSDLETWKYAKSQKAFVDEQPIIKPLERERRHTERVTDLHTQVADAAQGFARHAIIGGHEAQQVATASTPATPRARIAALA